MTRAIVLLALLAIVGCGPNDAPAARDDPAPNPELTPEVAQPLVHAAASIPKGLLDEITAAGAAVSPATLSTNPLSMLLLSVRYDGDQEDLRRLWKEGDPPWSPRKMWVPVSGDLVTLIPLESISEIEVATTEGQATGTYRFHREGYLAGKVEFHAERAEAGWRIVEFRLPAVKAKTVLQEDGTWKASEY